MEMPGVCMYVCMAVDQGLRALISDSSTGELQQGPLPVAGCDVIFKYAGVLQLHPVRQGMES